MPQKTSVEYVKQAVPAFLQRFKEETGYKEHSLEDKNRDLEEDKDTGDREDERPQVVQLSASDLSAAEAKHHWDSELAEEKAETSVQEVVNPDDLKDESGGKIMFKKPKKRCNDNLDSNVNKKKKSEAKKQVSKDKSKGLKNTKLLSFDCNDDDET